jgi:Predicted metal-dependent hydrolase
MKASIIEYSIARRRRETVEIAVLPDGSVVVAAPMDLPEESIARLVERRSAWIRRKRAFFQEFEPRRPPRRYVGGESHLLLGKSYRLRIVRGKPGVAISGDRIVVTTPTKSPSEVASRLDAWNRRQAYIWFSMLLDDAWRSFGYSEHDKPHLRVMALVRRWGSLSKNGRLTLNIALIQAPKACIEYVIVHELCHIKHPGHGPDFLAALGKSMPDWEKRKDRLEQFR